MPDLFIKKSDHKIHEDPEQKIGKIISHKKNRPHMFSAYCENPEKIYFSEAEPDEKIILLVRRHFITNIPWIFLSAVFLISPLILNFLVNFFSINLTFLPQPYPIFILILYYLIVFAYTLSCYFTWYFNISLITQKRLIDVDFSDLVYKNVAATKLELIQDASYTQAGVIRNVFNYGDVIIQTAGNMENFDLLAAPNPEKIIKIVEGIIGRENHAN